MAWHSHQQRGRLASAGLALLVTGLLACGKHKPEIVQGECRPLHGADICVWGELSGDSLVEFGATVPLGSVENAPAEPAMAWPPVVAASIPLPAAVKSATGFDNLRIYWEAHGHPPGPYLVPHFDFHFYTIPDADVAAIDCADSTKPGRLPAAYVLPDLSLPQIGNLIGLCVPGMGMHALPGAELSGSTPFQQTMVMGYYHGRQIFTEPMIARATLLERHSFQVDIPEVPDRPADRSYPTRFRADYDSSAQAYKFVFSDLTGAGAP